MLIGNKTDLEDRRAVSYQEGEDLARAHGLVFVEASAKTSKNVDEAFFKTAMEIHKMIVNGEINVNDEVNSFPVHYCFFHVFSSLSSFFCFYNTLHFV